MSRSTPWRRRAPVGRSATRGGRARRAGSNHRRACHKVVADVLARHGAGSLFLNYHPRWAPTPFGGALRVGQGRGRARRPQWPRPRRRRSGVRVDFGATLRGWCKTRRAASSSEHLAPDVALIEATDKALAAGIARGSACNTWATSARDRRGRPHRGVRPAGRPRRPRHRPHHA